MLIFVDTEVNNKNEITEIGCINENDETIKSNRTNDVLLYNFLSKGSFFVGHNFISHDKNLFENTALSNFFVEDKVIDTLYLSVLLFPSIRYHKLKKKYKMEGDFNDPVKDSKETKERFITILEEFNNLDEELKIIYYNLLGNQKLFKGFFNYVNFKKRSRNLDRVIHDFYHTKICKNVKLNSIIKKHPVELAYVLSTIDRKDSFLSIFPDFIKHTFPAVIEIRNRLRDVNCHKKCPYCDDYMDPVMALKKLFNHPSFKQFDDKNLQEEAVKSALRKESLIAVFPTGGGKSLTFQLPALMEHKRMGGLTVVISPLVSLMKDQVDSLKNKSIPQVATLNGLLNSIERKIVVDQVMDGSIALLYISPESLRSKTTERILKSRDIVRFVIDEAHCFSIWGQDFRPDYLYIGKFIKKMSNVNTHIPVSCFTATAKPNVIAEIKGYFKTHLNTHFKEFIAESKRSNLEYFVKPVEDDEDRFRQLMMLLDVVEKPLIIFSSRVKTVKNVSGRLSSQNIYNVTHFHGKLESEEKITHQDLFMENEADIMVATSAFGMGVDKDNIKTIIHYEAPDSLENYSQESGRAARREGTAGKCYLLYNENDLNKHFELLNATKLNIDEIKQVWRTIKEETKDKETISISPLELARKTGWDEKSANAESNIRTAVAALEEAKYIERDVNNPRVYADSLLVKSVMEGRKIIEQSKVFEGKELEDVINILRFFIQTRGQVKRFDESAETRIDYLALKVGIDKEKVIDIVTKFREIRILSDDTDLKAFVKRNSTANIPYSTLNTSYQLIMFLVDSISENIETYSLKLLNEEAESRNIKSSIRLLRTMINYLSTTKFILLQKEVKDVLKLKLMKDKQEVKAEMEKRYSLALKAIQYVYDLSKIQQDIAGNIVDFSILDLKEYCEIDDIFSVKLNIKEVENALYYLQYIGGLRIEGGFLVTYLPLTIRKIQKNPHIQYKKEDYHRLGNYYNTKTEQIHIIGEYANKMIEDADKGQLFVRDYFEKDFADFKKAYFKGARAQDLKKTMTPSKYEELFGTLSDEQNAVINDKINQRISVLAGPGSGKTKILVHKLASVIQTEDTKPEHLLMLTFSRAAATLFKSRLIDLIGDSAYGVTIMTFHSFAFDLLGRVGTLEKSDTIVKDATALIESGEADNLKITKTVLVIDEAQDMTKDEYNLINAIINHNDGIRVIAVGDDDQNIFEFRDSDSKYLKMLSGEEPYELTKNFRSKNNLVMFSNKLISMVSDRLKKKPIISYTDSHGSISIIYHPNNNFTVSVVDDVINRNLDGTTCVITSTNEEAEQIAGNLNHKNYSAKLIQSTEGFRLSQLKEIHNFYEFLKTKTDGLIEEEHWKEAFAFLKSTFGHSTNYEVSLDILSEFKKVNGHYGTLPELNEYLFESNYSDFQSNTRLMVSTFHKAKGKEFDNVFIVLDNKRKLSDEQLRTFYVGITRAKTNLIIHTNNKDISQIKAPNSTYYEDLTERKEPPIIAIQLTLSDVNLGYFKYTQVGVQKLTSGDELIFDGKVFIFGENKILQTSKKMNEKLEEFRQRGYHLLKATVSHLVYWYNEEDDTMYLTVLPEFTFIYEEPNEE